MNVEQDKREPTKPKSAASQANSFTERNKVVLLAFKQISNGKVRTTRTLKREGARTFGDNAERCA